MAERELTLYPPTSTLYLRVEPLGSLVQWMISQKSYEVQIDLQGNRPWSRRVAEYSFVLEV